MSDSTTAGSHPRRLDHRVPRRHAHAAQTTHRPRTHTGGSADPSGE